LTPAARAAARAELDTPDAAVVIILVGRMETLKGHAVHLEALGLLKGVPGWVCWQIGGAQRDSEIEYVDGLKRLAVRLGIGERVRFAGERPDIPRLLAAADIYCQPNTRPESFGLTFIEAMLARLPVVTTDIGGAREIVDASCGLLVPPGDVRALARALRTLIEDPAGRDALSGESPARPRELCDPAGQLSLLYESLKSISGC
ncbi:MAG: glycosyltransferase, partial [Acidobacteriota bacterium]|nr:glycosyltransferase [Acidobacteriota bacterium]